MEKVRPRGWIPSFMEDRCKPPSLSSLTKGSLHICPVDMDQTPAGLWLLGSGGSLTLLYASSPLLPSFQPQLGADHMGGLQDPAPLQPLLAEPWGANTYVPPPRNRVAFTKSQLKILEWAFEQSPYPDQGTRRHLAGLLLLPEARVQVWFKNRRAKLRRGQRLQQPEEQRSMALKGAEVASCLGPEFLPAASRTRPQTPVSESYQLCQRPESQVQGWQGSLGSSWNIGLGLGWGVPWACQALAWTVTPRWGTIPSHWLCSPPAQSWLGPPASYSPLYRLTTSLRPTNLTNHPINRYLLYPPFMRRSVLSDVMG